MLFNSYIFVFLFFPICLAGYYGLIHWKKKEMAQLFLVAMSFWFYGYFQVNYLLIMITSILVNYAFHRILSKELPRNAAKGIMIAAVAAHLEYQPGFWYGVPSPEDCITVRNQLFYVSTDWICGRYLPGRNKELQTAGVRFVCVIFSTADSRTNCKSVRNVTAVCGNDRTEI